VAIAMLLFIFFIASTRSKGPREALANSPSAMRMLAFTGPDEDAWQPSFSPDGKRIAFSRWGSDAAASGIYVKEIGADRQTQLTKEGRDRSASWSPDGNTIAFSRREDPNFALFTVPAEGGPEHKLNSPGVNAKRGELDWSPNGKWLAFNGGSALYL